MSRNTTIIYALLSLVLLCGCQGRSPSRSATRTTSFPSATPVKEYEGEGMGSVYAFLATLEAEHLSRGDSVNLSAPYLVRAWLKERALNAYFSGRPFGEDLPCTVPRVAYLLSAYGLYPYDAYPARGDYRQSVVTRKLWAVVAGARAHPSTLDRLSRSLDLVLDRSMGYLPARLVHFLGADYTPQEFARSVCAPGEYVRLVSFKNLPPGNLSMDSSTGFYPLELGGMPTRNLPLDSLTRHLRMAVEAGHAVCWEGDTTNIDFRHRQAWWVTLSSPSTDEASSRQRAFERLSFTLDHAFAIVGMTRHGGEVYYRCKNCRGVGWGDQGYVYLSESYVRRYTFALTMNQTALLGQPW